jgi:hypothetical protein
MKKIETNCFNGQENCDDKKEPKSQLNYLSEEKVNVPYLLKKEEEAETNNSLIKIPKGHGGQREVTLLTMIEELKNSNKHTNQKRADLKLNKRNINVV